LVRLVQNTFPKERYPSEPMKKEKKTSLNKKDLIALMMSDVAELTESRFLVHLTSDDGGNHIEIQLENNDDSSKVRNFIDKNYSSQRIIIMNVPEGFLKEEL
jgi:hypothetical protein